MRIGIDVDDTIANTSVLVYSEIEKNFKKFSKVDNLESKIRDMMRGIISDEDRKLIDVSIFSLLKDISIKDDASECIDFLKNNGNEIYIITSRSNEVLQTDAHDLTKKWLDENNVNYNMIICNASDKLDACINHNIDIMIDDSVHICELLNNNGIRSIVFNAPTNIKLETSLPRVNDWIELKAILK